MTTDLNVRSENREICRFPKLDECAHFHYEKVSLATLRLTLLSSSGDDRLTRSPRSVLATAPGKYEQAHQQQQQQHNWLLSHDDGDLDGGYTIEVLSGNGSSDGSCSWLIQRTWHNCVLLDKLLHQCIFDRKVSQLFDLQSLLSPQKDILREYMSRLSAILNNSLNCAPILNWFQLDNRGRRLLVSNQAINTPAVAAAYSVRQYSAQANDEISLEVGDVISVIDMAAVGETEWWRGKRGFQVGFFPQRCVHIIGDKWASPVSSMLRAATVRPVAVEQPERSTSAGGQAQATAPTLSPPSQQRSIKPVLKKHGKLIALFRSFILSRPARQCLKERGILKERVFGCDLGEHLLNSGQQVPKVLKYCSQFIESHGIVDGIYRLSGITSNIQRLRHIFDEDRTPNLYEPDIVQDIHSVASLLKMYFRELPNPLCTYQLYAEFIGAIEGFRSGSESANNSVIIKMRETVHKLPPPHYRTLEYLMRHLNRVASHGHRTGMTCRNIAIVWSPNLLRSEELLGDHLGVAVLQGVGVQAVVTEFLVSFADLIFNDNFDELCEPFSTKEICPASPIRFRPKSLAIMSTTPTKLLTLKEAQEYNFNRNERTILENYKHLIDVGPNTAEHNQLPQPPQPPQPPLQPPQPELLRLANLPPLEMSSVRNSSCGSHRSSLAEPAPAASAPFHTVIDLSQLSKRSSATAALFSTSAASTSKKPVLPVSSWKSFFTKNQTASLHRRKNVSLSNSLDKKAIAMEFSAEQKKAQPLLRSVKSVEVLNEKKLNAVGTQTILSIFKKQASSASASSAAASVPQRASHSSYFETKSSLLLPSLLPASDPSRVCGPAAPALLPPPVVIAKLEVGSLTDLDVEFEHDLLDGSREMQMFSDEESVTSSPRVTACAHARQSGGRLRVHLRATDSGSNASLSTPSSVAAAAAVHSVDERAPASNTESNAASYDKIEWELSSENKENEKQLLAATGQPNSKLEDQISDFTFIDSNVTTPESECGSIAKAKFLNRLSLNCDRVKSADASATNAAAARLVVDIADTDAKNARFLRKSMTDCNMTPESVYFARSVDMSSNSTTTTSLSSLKYET